jgi:hypothetical protein
MAAVINIRGVPLDAARQEVARFKEPDGREVAIALKGLAPNSSEMIF